MTKSKIEWTEETWNPVTGCSKVSAGCKFCYAEVMANRLKSMGVEKYKNNFKVTTHKKSLDEPYHWKKPRTVFVNSMSDLFHKDVPTSFILDVFKVMNECPLHTFQVLTKRPERLLELNKQIDWTPNIWMGVSVENKEVTSRITLLKKSNAKIKFLSVEPLIGALGKLHLKGIDWVIVGGESGPNSRPIEESWVDEVFEQCKDQKIAFFFKQWGGRNKKKTGRVYRGKLWNEYPKLPS